MKVILISGKQGSGKTTLTVALVKALEALGHKAYPAKFAGPIYAMADMVYMALDNVGAPQDMNTPEFKKLLQVLGMWGRESFGADFWAKMAHRVAVNAGLETDNGFLIYDDCRFPNEISVFREPFVIRLWASEDARKARADRWRDTTQDPTETAMDDLEDETWDAIFNTDQGPGGWGTDQIVDAVLIDLGVK